MSDLDHRNYSIPLFLAGSALLGAGVVALVANAITPIGDNNAAGAIGAGLVLLFASIAVTILLNPRSDLAAAPRRTVPLAAGTVAILLLAGVSGGAAMGGVVEPDASGEPTGTVAGPGAAPTIAALGVEDFSGTLQGAVTPLGGTGGPGTTSQAHEVAVPPGALALRAELAWTRAGPAGAQELELRIETTEGEVLAAASDGSPLVLDLTEIPEGGLRLVVSLPEGAVSTSQDYDAYASYFADAVPDGYSAAEP